MEGFGHIMVPLDFTPKNEAALAAARHVSSPTRTQIDLLHVVETITADEEELLSDFYSTLRRNASRKLQSVANPLCEAGYCVRTRVLLGRPARRIVVEADSTGVDLIVLSSHALGAQTEPAHWATVSYQVSLFCRCPVLLVK